MTNGLSITSTPLLFLSKLRNKRNPYAQPHHPNNHSQVHIQDPTAPRDPQTCQAPAHSDLLAEARLVAGRHPVTGRCISTEPQPQTQTQSRSWTGKSKAKGIGKGKGKQKQKEISEEEANEQKKAYVAWAAKNPQMRGSPYASYEEFVKEKVARRGLPEEGGRWVRGEYYAPG